MRSISRSLMPALLGCALVAGACSEKRLTDVERSPTDGLSQGTVSDSSGNPLPTRTDTAPASPGGPIPGVDTLANAGPGYFRGIVRAAGAAPGSDSLVNSVRIANVTVTAYARLNNGDAGAQVATTTTNVSGEWQLPTMPTGHYVVTFTPPPASNYRGVWVSATAHPWSHVHPWWVTLSPK